MSNKSYDMFNPWKVLRVSGRWDVRAYPEVRGFRVSTSRYDLNPDEVEADAALMAKAPDLRRSLKFLVEAAKTEPGMAIYKAHIEEAERILEESNYTK